MIDAGAAEEHAEVPLGHLVQLRDLALLLGDAVRAPRAQRACACEARRERTHRAAQCRVGRPLAHVLMPAAHGNLPPVRPPERMVRTDRRPHIVPTLLDTSPNAGP